MYGNRGLDDHVGPLFTVQIECIVDLMVQSIQRVPNPWDQCNSRGSCVVQSDGPIMAGGGGLFLSSLFCNLLEA